MIVSQRGDFVTPLPARFRANEVRSNDRYVARPEAGLLGRRYRTVKGRMLAEIVDTLSRDLSSAQFIAPWLWSLLPDRSPLRNRLPWMNFKVIRWLNSYLKPEMRAFEFGTGGSTIFLSRRIRDVTSIESDTRWYDDVSRALKENGIGNCDLRLIPAEPPNASKAPDMDGFYKSTAKGVAGYDFERYVRAIDELRPRSLDLVIVDGYARLACIAHAIPKVRLGGYVLVDDTDWKKYRLSFDLLSQFPRTDFVGVTPFQLNLRQTSVWRIS